LLALQPVPEKKRLEMVIGIHNEILGGHHRFVFMGRFEKRPQLSTSRISFCIPSILRTF
jgi:hypothetical protein